MSGRTLCLVLTGAMFLASAPALAEQDAPKIAVTPQAPLPMQWAQFSRSGLMSGVGGETVDIATGDRKGTGQFQYRLRLTRKWRDEPAETRWADSLTCPAVRPVIASMHDLAMPAPAPYGVPGEPTQIILDGMEYSLTAPSSDPMGKITISSNIGSPLANWIEASLKLLAPCWTAAQR